MSDLMLNDILQNDPELEKRLQGMAISNNEVKTSEEYVNPETGEVNPNFIYPDDELPNMSILMPTYNRRNFIGLIAVNLANMNYPKDKLELVIYDDHPDNPLFINDEEVLIFQERIQIKVNYIYNCVRHLSIGEKRNKLVKAAKYKICINMDDDDIYLEQYFKTSVTLLKQNKAGIVGSPEMLFTYPHLDYKMSGIRCESKRQIHEATFCFTKQHWKSMGGFVSKGESSSRGEGAKMIDFNEKKCVKSNIGDCMVCISHKNNTVDKMRFKDSNCDAIEFNIPDIYKTLIDEILSIKRSEPSVNQTTNQ